MAGHAGPNTSREIAYREADVFLLCYKVTDIATLFSAINIWVPELRGHAPATPIVLVGCQADLRADRLILQNLAKIGRSPVSQEQARSFSQQVDAVSYVETSSKLSSKGPEAIFQLAAKISLEQVKEQEFGKLSPVSTSTPSNSLERTTESPESFWDQYQSPPLPRTQHFHTRSASLSSSLNSTKSSISLPAPRSPLMASRRNSMSLRTKPVSVQEKFIKIKCQRLNEHKIYEEVEIEVPAPIYENLQASNERNSLERHAGNFRRKESFGSKLKSLFLRD